MCAYSVCVCFCMSITASLIRFVPTAVVYTACDTVHGSLKTSINVVVAPCDCKAHYTPHNEIIGGMENGEKTFLDGKDCNVYSLG